MPKLYFIRGYSRIQTRNSILMNAKVDLVETYTLIRSIYFSSLTYPYYFDGPHFPEMGLAVYCEKGRKGELM